MRISVITVVRNNRAGLVRTAASLREQERELVEWIVIDGGSTDGTDAAVEEFPELLDVFVSEPDEGLYDAMNKGLRRATGQYVMFLNGDDVLLPGSLRLLADRLQEEERAGRAYSLIFAGAILRLASGRARYRPPLDAERSLWHRLPSSHQAILVDRQEHLDVPHNREFRVSSDYYTIARIYQSRKRGVLYVDHPVVETPIGGSSFSSSNRMTLLRDHIQIQRRILKVAPALVFLSVLRKLAAMMAVTLLGLRFRDRPAESAHAE